MNTVVIAILIFLARIVDVTLGTLKLKAVMRGNKGIAFCIAFVEVLVYTLAASYAFKYIEDITVLMMFAFGYASGNFIGIAIDEKMSRCNVMTLIITDHDEWKLADTLREQGYAVTTNKSYGLSGNQKAELKVIVPKEKLREMHKVVTDCDDSAYMVVFDVKGVNRIPVEK